MSTSGFEIRPAGESDLPGINAVIERAVMTWDLPERVKRLSLPVYRYQPHDLDHLEMFVAEDATGGILGVAAWEPAADREMPGNGHAFLLHGLYVDPMRHGEGIGTRLLGELESRARLAAATGLLVKAQAGAQGFFESRGFAPLPVTDSDKDYPHRLWRSLSD